jgi:hypothetical protein
VSEFCFPEFMARQATGGRREDPPMTEDDALLLYEALQRIKEIAGREEILGSEVYEIQGVLDEVERESPL